MIDKTLNWYKVEDDYPGLAKSPEDSGRRMNYLVETPREGEVKTVTSWGCNSALEIM